MLENSDKSETLQQAEVAAEESLKAAAATTPCYDLTKFRLARILNNNTKRKSVTLLGTFPDVSETNSAIVIFEKNAFRESEVQTPNAKKLKATNGAEENEDEIVEETVLAASSYFNNALQVQMEFMNDIYGNFQCIPQAELNGLKTTVVYPATEKHIKKYTSCQKYAISETPELYRNITLPYIESNSSQFSLEWVYNILEHKQEKERIVYEDNDAETGFVLLPDLKWDGHSVETLYMLAIVRKRNIKSLRDLRSEHLPLLCNMQKRIAQVIEERYELSANQLRFYFHYQPSFYHLHLHVNLLTNDVPGIWAEKAHMLETVINNLQLLPDYYERATLPFVLYEDSKFLTIYENVIPIRKKAQKRAADNESRNDEETVITPSKKQKINEDNTNNQ